jgi:phosphate-selective porin OprO/OprP
MRVSPHVAVPTACVLALTFAMAPGVAAAREGSFDDEPQSQGAPAESDKKPKKEKTKEAEPEGWHRDGFGVRNGKSLIEVVGYVQWDFRKFDWTVQGGETGLETSPERELRRLRMGVQGKLGGASFEFVVDPRKSQIGSRLKDATVGYEFGKGFNLLVGHFKPPFSRDFLTSASKTDYVERSMIGERLVPDREWGVSASGEVSRLEYSVGVFSGDGDANTQSAGTSGAGRLVVRVVKGFEIGGSFMQGDVTPDPRVGTTEPGPKGASGVSTSGFTFWNRAHVDGTRRRMGGDLAYSKGPFKVLGEYLQVVEQRKGQGSTGQDIPDVRGRGFNAQASYVLTGERKGTTVEPDKSLFKGGTGAIEIVARAQALKFDDTGDPSGFAGYGNRARNIAPSGSSSMEAGLNYWASNFMKLQGSALWESYNDPLIAPTPGKKGRYFTLQARIQFMLP